MAIKVVMATPTPIVGLPPPPLDVYWLPRGSTPLGTSALGSSVTVDPGLLQLLLAQGFTLSSWTSA
jgi:hypothetical protein